ncbi:hypothetical protein DB347_12130 [Opitutaceae bacterium EW11]|nr:hypothetical protein DB347_12130 [Opitutaceae bacterium EW11]
MRRVLLMYGLFEPSERHLAALRALGADPVTALDEDHAIEAGRTAEMFLGHRYLRQCLPGASRLRWVQTTAGGVDRLPCRELARRGILLTRVTFTAPMIARHAHSLAWALTRAVPQAIENQKLGRWITALPWLPRPKTAAVFGFGAIGQEIAHLLRRDGIAVHAVNRFGCLPPGAFPPASLRPVAESAVLLPEIDWCFLAMPANAESVGLVNAAFLARLKPTALLVNVGRGSSVVTADLCAALREGRLGGAALDVVEPLPESAADPLWATPRLLLTPHVAAHYSERPADMERFAEEQVARYLHGDPLKNPVDCAAFA